jgi:endonuclease/exonuclease/phosphatase family metal-dependent hydrolase
MMTTALVTMLSAIVVLGLLYVTRGPSLRGPRATPTIPHLATKPSGVRGTQLRPKTPSRSAADPEPLPTATSSTCVPLQPDRHLTVVTFNIHSARSRDHAVRLGAIAGEIERWQPDVVLLQEVDQHRFRTGRADQPALLGSALGMVWTYAGNHIVPPGRSGTAILSRYPIVSARNLRLPRPRGTQQRGLLHALLDVDGTVVSIYDTHLENSSRKARLAQMHTIRPIVETDRRPKIFGGDLNSSPGSDVIKVAGRVLNDTWTEVGSGAGLTMPSGSPRRRIDYLLYGDGRTTDVQPLGARVVHSQVSDHRALRATYRLRGTSGAVCLPIFADPTG